MMLPFLKAKRTPRIAPEPTEQKLINGSSDDHMDDHFMGQVFDAVESKDVSKFRSAIEALVLNMFDWDSDDE